MKTTVRIWWLGAIWLASTVAATFAGGHAGAAGLMNMPTSARQWLGCGFGPGYHAPMHLGIPCASKSASQHIHYTWRSPKPAGCPGGLCASMSAIQAGSAIEARSAVEAAPSNDYYYQAPLHPVGIQGASPAYEQPRSSQPLFAAPEPVPMRLPPAAATPHSQRGYEPISPSDAARPEEIRLPDYEQ